MVVSSDLSGSKLECNLIHMRVGVCFRAFFNPVFASYLKGFECWLKSGGVSCAVGGLVLVRGS